MFNLYHRIYEINHLCRFLLKTKAQAFDNIIEKYRHSLYFLGRIRVIIQKSAQQSTEKYDTENIRIDKRYNYSIKTMIKIQLLFLLISVISKVHSQTFEIHSIPRNGISLDRQWHFQKGDNLKWAEKKFDDSKWQSIDPTQDIMRLSQFQEQSLGWFRIRLRVNATLFGQTYGLAIKQTGSSEIFVNGVRIKTFGNFNTPYPLKNYGFDPSENAIKLRFDSTEFQTIAVRFQKPPTSIRKHIFYDNIALRLKILPIEAIVENYNSANHITLLDHYLDVFKAGLMFFLALFYLFLYGFDTSRKGYILVSIWTFFGALSLILGTISFYISDIDSRNMLSVSTLFLIATSYTSQYIAILFFFGRNLKVMTFIVVIGYVLSIIFLVLNYTWGWILGTFVLNVLASTGIMHVSWQAYKSGEIVAKFICFGNTIFMIFFIFSILIVSKQLNINISYWIVEVIVNLGVLIPVVAYIYFFASKFDINRKELLTKVNVIEQLYFEKQEALKKQNIELQAALLQGQTIERKRVAADLHDNLGSTMSSLIWTIEAINTNKMAKEEKMVLQNLKKMLDSAYEEVRLLSHNLLPEEFEIQGLVSALRYFIRKVNNNSNIDFRLDINYKPSVANKQTEFELYSICLELVNNIIKHSKASHASILLFTESKQIILRIEDNGIGITQTNGEGRGIKNVKNRAESLGGSLTFLDISPHGTCSEIRVPKKN